MPPPSLPRPGGDAGPHDALCRRIAASDPAAFAEAFADLRAPLLRYVGHLLGDGLAAHDLVQDVFAALWADRATLDPPRPLAPLLFRMARYRALNALRDRRLHAARHEALHDDALRGGAGAADAEPPLDADALAVRLARWVGALPARQREALALTRTRGLSHADAAAVMAVSPRTLNNHLVRALATLAERLAAYDPDLARRR